MAKDSYRRCIRCVMDSDDLGISFNAKGECNYCTEAFEKIRHGLLPPEKRDRALQALVHEIKEKGKGRPYDCVIGLSGGVDSTAVAYLVSKLGLRPYAVHLDNGWNSPEAERNMKMTAERLGIRVDTYVVDPEEFIDLQRAYLKASVGNIEAPTDHGIWSLLYRTAAKQNISFILSGSNLATESILVRGWGTYNQDLRNILAIHDEFGSVPLRTLPTMSIIDYVKYVHIAGIRSVWLLNYIDYNKFGFKQILTSELGWQDYGGKHFESIWTRFFQSYILPRKFGVDKRKSHLSSLICAGQLSRDDAIEELKKPVYEPDMLKHDLGLVLEKLKLSREEFETMMAEPPRRHTDYPNNSCLFDSLRVIMRRFPWVRDWMRSGFWRR